MNRLQKILLAALVIGLLTAIILTWGSIGSAVLVFCLMMVGASLLYQRFLNNHDQDSWDTE
ncbi:MAG: hypothetical protein IJ001_12740 [Oscillospiraceae bacterium]|nr:hypothetical protein [Oscillospiraceae bacterium]MBQ8835772.1 hypothetical protein [Oscillospiraceae bacterium]